MAYFLCMATAHVTDFKVPILFVYFDVPSTFYQNKIILPHLRHSLRVRRHVREHCPRSHLYVHYGTRPRARQHVGSPSHRDEETRQRLGAEARSRLVQEGYAGLLGADRGDRRICGCPGSALLLLLNISITTP